MPRRVDGRTESVETSSSAEKIKNPLNRKYGRLEDGSGTKRHIHAG